MFDWVIYKPPNWNFQSESKVEQIIVIVTTRGVSCFYSYNWYLITLLFQSVDEVFICFFLIAQVIPFCQLNYCFVMSSKNFKEFREF